MVARIELSAEFRSIEQIIESGDRLRANQELERLGEQLRRRPEYRYLSLLFETVFSTRSDADLLRDTRELVAEQPDLAEATALLALLFSRVGDQRRADLFAREALTSPSPSAQLRASQILGLRPKTSNTPQPGSGPVAMEPPSFSPPSSTQIPKAEPYHSSKPAKGQSLSTPMPVSAMAVMAATSASSIAAAPSAPPIRRTTSSPARAAVAVARSVPPDSEPISTTTTVGSTAPGPLEQWFEWARRERLQHRSSIHGRSSTRLEQLLAAGRAVTLGQSSLGTSPIVLSRTGLGELDAIIAERRRARAQAGIHIDAPPEDIDAAAGFLLAVALRELDARAAETAADDGFCKVTTPSGSGLRPVIIATSALQGTGPGLLHAFERLASTPARAALQSPVPSGPPPSSGSMLAARAVSIPISASQDDLAMTRPEVELATARRLRRPIRPAGPPPIDPAAIAAAFADSSTGAEIARDAGIERLPPTRQVAALLEAYAGEKWDARGLSPASTTWHPPEELDQIIVAWGSMLGEALIAEYGGVWECDPNTPGDPRLFRVICQDRVAAWPITHVYLRLKNGVRFHLAEFVVGVGRLL